MDYKKPQSTLVQGGAGIYPLTTADQVILADGSRLEKDGHVHADVLGGKTLAEIMLALYPVGAVYSSANSTSPASLFGGTWESVGGRFLLGADATYAAGSTGGEANHTLTVGEIPPERIKYGSGKYYYIKDGIVQMNTTSGWSGGLTFSESGIYATTEGGGQPHNNMPPYLAVYMWKRVS